MASITPEMKKVYAHALQGLTRELEAMAAWPGISIPVQSELTTVISHLVTAALDLHQGREAVKPLASAAAWLPELTYRTLPGSGGQVVDDALAELNLIRIQLGYM